MNYQGIDAFVMNETIEKVIGAARFVAKEVANLIPGSKNCGWMWFHDDRIQTWSGKCLKCMAINCMFTLSFQVSH